MKKVQFSSTNLMYSPLPWSPDLNPDPDAVQLPPSPFLSHATLLHAPLPESADEPPAEPEPAPQPERATYTPAPSAPQLHVLLAFSPFSPPAVTYDVAHPPHTLNAQLTPSFLEPATHPPRAVLALRCRRLPFADDWTISIVPSHPAGVVCVLDVLRAVYSALRTAVRRAEYDSLGADGARQRVDAAYFARCRMLAGEEERQVEVLKGVKRVDFLCGKTRFLGLSGPLAPDGAGVWELNVSD
ncbi:hypothetical protein GGX14DRAFT_376649 [Mycena pura]|uniref:DUF6699 domain-containing protein n=1 Tax=Mycena pura TaxID=153505 RepID=A0AAD6Y869_9AGAR|nr:hypothetical protein GGX14DRAFT_376649 [Mycena pura]